MGAKLFNAILRSGSMLDKWRKSILFPIYMKKRDIQECVYNLAFNS